MRFEIPAEAGIGLGFAQDLRRFAIETEDVADHPVEGWPEQVAALGEQGVEIVAVVFETRSLATQAEAHLRRQRVDAAGFQQINEFRIGALVVDDETGVDGVLFVVDPNIVGMGMPADVVIGLEHHEFMPAVQQMGTGQAGNTGSDDRDFHPCRFVKGGA